MAWENDFGRDGIKNLFFLSDCVDADACFQKEHVVTVGFLVLEIHTTNEVLVHIANLDSAALVLQVQI